MLIDYTFFGQSFIDDKKLKDFINQKKAREQKP